MFNFIILSIAIGIIIIGIGICVYILLDIFNVGFEIECFIEILINKISMIGAEEITEEEYKKLWEEEI